MTDPVAEAAAKIAAQAAEPSLLDKAMDTIHDLEAKVEHLIHPESVPNVTPESPAIDASATLLGASEPITGIESSAKPCESFPIQTPMPVSSIGSIEPSTIIPTSSAGSEAGNVGGRSNTGLTPTPIIGAAESAAIGSPTSTANTSLTSDGMTSAGTNGAKGESTTLTTATTSATDLPNVIPASTSGTPPESTPSADSGLKADAGNVATVASEAMSGATVSDTALANSGAEAPNAAPAAVEQPIIADSAQDASTVGIQGVASKLLDEAVNTNVSYAVSTAIRSNLAAIKHHLSIRGFEQSAVADIHAELDAIEKWL
jgi:hypothetical protein